MPVSAQGKEYNINGQHVMLYPISVLAKELSEALGDVRTTQTIRKWENNKVIPPAIFRVGDKRLYSMEQIQAICKVAKECGIKRGHALALTNFSSLVWEELRVINKKYKEKRN